MHGGASARPFVTHSNAFDTELFLRIAPELLLKRAVVGGIERVFEINRNFRNEGADSTHSPEFAMLEAYQAYGDYNQMADLTQELIQNAAHGRRRLARRDLGRRHRVRPRRRLGAHLDVRLALGGGRGVEITPETPIDELEELADAEGIEVDHPLPRQVRRGALGALREGRPRAADLRHGLPASTRRRSCASTGRSPGVVEKWDLYVRGFELATGYSELVDPVVQRERFVEQAKLAAGGDLEAMRLDEEFLRALEHGMPPIGRHGHGHRPPAHGAHRSRHPRDDPLPARQVARPVNGSA